MTRKTLPFLLITSLLLLALLSIGRAIHFSFFSPAGGIDFYGFWRAGLFIRQFHNPYSAYLAGEAPTMPIAYLDGSFDNELPHDLTLSIAPTNTAPLLLVITLFSWLPWPIAKTAWFVLNALLVASLPWLANRLLPASSPLSRTDALSLAFTFYAFKSTRGVLGTGQTTAVVVTLMLLCLLFWDRWPLWAGVALGLALSKYSVALPLFLYAFYQRRFRVIFISLMVQFAGILALTELTSSSPLAVVAQYYQIMQAHIKSPGLHLASLFAPDDPMRTLAPLLLTVSVGAILGWLLAQKPAFIWSLSRRQFHDLHVFTTFSLWTLLVAYHRPYDGVLVLLFLVLITFGLTWPESWHLPLRQQRLLLAFLIFAAAMFITPYEEIGKLLPGIFTPPVLIGLAKGVTLTLGAMLGVTLWLLRQARQQPEKAFLINQ